MQQGPSKVEAQYRTMVVIWAALVLSQLMFVLVVYLTRPELFYLDFSKPLLGGGRETGSSTALVIGFAFAAVTSVLFSFAFKSRLNERAVAEQNTAQVQSGLIIALALCEASSVFGLALAFAFDYPYFYFWIALGVVAMILHFPKRDPLHAASMRDPEGK